MEIVAAYPAKRGCEEVSRRMYGVHRRSRESLSGLCFVRKSRVEEAKSRWRRWEKKERKSWLFWSKLFRCAFLDGHWNSPPDGATWPPSTGVEWEQGDEEDAEEKGPISNYLVSSRLGRTNIFAHHCPATFYRHSTGVGEGPGGRGNLVKTESFSWQRILEF